MTLPLPGFRTVSRGGARLFGLALVVVSAISLHGAARADDAMAQRVAEIAPALEAYIEKGMSAFDLPGLAIGIVTDDRLVYGRGFGRRGEGGEPVTTGTVFQIGSNTKAFLAAAMAIGVDRDRLAWDDRVVDLDPGFRLMDHWVTGEFRMFDILAQRSGLPPLANDMYGMLGADVGEKIASLRHVEPATSFRAAFTYTNITHLIAARILAKAFGRSDWSEVLESEILRPLGMTDTSWTMEGIEAAPDHAQGYLWSPEGSVEVPFNRLMPYDYAGAGEINSTIDDLQRWVRVQLADGTFEGRRLVSSDALAVTLAPRVPIRKGASYAMGWIIESTPNAEITWHNGGTVAFGSYIGLARGEDVGVIVLTNQAHAGLPDAIGRWTLDRLLGNPEIDYAAIDLEAAKTAAAAMAKAFERPAGALPSIPLSSFAGDWSNPVFGTSNATVDGDALNLALPTGATLRLEPWNGDTFTVGLVPEGEMAVIAASFGPLPLGFAQFRIDGSGTYRKLAIDFTMESQEYVFTRDE